MALFKTLYLFSEVHGTVLLDGKPVQGVEVEQDYHWRWGGQKRTTTVTTDAQGRFHFAEVTGRSWTAGLLPHEPVIVQRITLRYQGKEHKGWFMAKHNYDRLGEVPGRPLNVVCDLADEAGPRPEIGTFGICELR
ncbi:Nickel uptake substrate-specific transmembrane region [compost metagenome]